MTVKSDEELWQMMQAMALKYGTHLPRSQAISMARAIIDQILPPEETESYDSHLIPPF